MDTIQHSTTIGKLFLTSSNDEQTEECNLTNGRFSITAINDYYILNFWVQSRFKCILESGEEFNWGGPILEIKRKIEQLPEKIDELMIEEPNYAIDLLNSNFQEWENFYRTGYYNGHHQWFFKYELKIKKQEDNYEIQFRGYPSDEVSTLVTGKCVLELHNKLEGYW